MPTQVVPSDFEFWSCHCHVQHSSCMLDHSTNDSTVFRNDNSISCHSQQRTDYPQHHHRPRASWNANLDSNPMRRQQGTFDITNSNHDLLDNSQYCVGYDNDDLNSSIISLPSTRFDFDNDRFHHNAVKHCPHHKRKNGHVTPYDRTADRGSPTTTDIICNSSFGSLGLGHLDLSSSSSYPSSRNVVSETTGLPSGSQVWDTIKEDDNNPLFWLPVDEEEGNTQLHLSVLERDVAKTKEIIGKATKFNDLNVLNKRGQSALHVAVSTGQAKVVRMLMCAGAYVAVGDVHGNTPLHLASCLGDVDVLKPLIEPIDYTEMLENTYQVPFCAIPQNMSFENEEGKTCLELATENKHEKIVDILSQII